MIKSVADADLTVSRFLDIPHIEYSVVMYNSVDELSNEYKKHSDGFEKPDWMIGFATTNREIFVLSPDIMPAGTEINGKIRSEKNLIHEIAHIYTDSVNAKLPQWLKEGIALTIAEQDYWTKKSTDGIDINLLKEIEKSQTDPRNYKVGKIMVENIISKYGRRQLLDLIMIKDKKHFYKKLKELFEWL